VRRDSATPTLARSCGAASEERSTLDSPLGGAASSISVSKRRAVRRTRESPMLGERALDDVEGCARVAAARV